MYTILVVEDEEILRNNLSELLENSGYKVIVANNGLEGYKAVVGYEPDLILCDILMPVMDGTELLEKLRHNKITRSIPFIFLTAKAELTDMRKCMTYGADDYIIKPFKAQDLLKSIDLRINKIEDYLSAVNEFKDILMRKVPHELRTPLVGILGLSDMMMNDKEDFSKEEFINMAKVIHHAGKRLHRRIEKFLIYADLLRTTQTENPNEEKEEEKFELVPEDVSSQLEKKFEDFEKEDDLEINLESACIKCNSFQFEILLNELLENSVKFSNEGDHIAIMGNKQDKYYKVKFVSSSTEQNNLYSNEIKPFNQFGKENSTEEGLGIGLAIVKRIVEMLDGYIIFKSSNDFKLVTELGLPLDL